MNLLLDLLGAVILICAVCASIAWLVVFPLVAGYVLLRVLLKISGLHSASPDQLRGEIKLAKFLGVLLLFTVVWYLFLAIFGCDTGID